MKKSSLVASLLSICAVILFISGIVTFKDPERVALGSTFVSLGFLCLSLGIYLSRRSERKPNENEK